MNKRILIYNSGGGLGDSIQLFSIIKSLNNYFKNAEIFYLGAHENHFIGKLKEYNIKIKSLDLNLKYFGFRWWHLTKVKKIIKENNINKFNLVIDLQSKLRNTLVLRQIPHTDFFSSTFNFIFCNKKNKYLVNKGNLSLSIFSNLEIFLNDKIKKIEFNLDMLDQKFIEESVRLLPKDNYVGFSITQGNKYRKKTWAIENFIKLANELHLKGKKIVFFVEKNEIDLVKLIKTNLPQAIFPEHESKIACPALVTALGSRLERAISIDNGVMHMLSLAKIPLIVLFGPTDSYKFAPKNENVKILDSKSIYNSNDINKITISDVLKKFN